MKLQFTILLLSVILLGSCGGSSDSKAKAGNDSASVSDSPATRTTPVQKTEVPKVTIEEAIELSKQGYRFVDCRTPKEIADGKIEGALEMNVRSYTYAEIIKDSLNQDDKIIVYCQAGVRSALAAKLFSELEFPNVVDMTGGYEEWLEYHQNQ